MRRLIEQRYALRKNLPILIGMMLGLYFSYHICFGDRSYMRLMTLEGNAKVLSMEYERLYEQRTIRESKVVRLRPGSLDPDLLEERTRYVLGYVRPDETIIMR